VQFQISCQPLHTITGKHGAELVGPLPAEIQLSTLFPAAVGTGAKEPEAAKAFIKFLTAPATIPVLKAKGLEPG